VGGVNKLEGGGVNTVKTLKFEKVGGCMTPWAYGLNEKAKFISFYNLNKLFIK